MSKISFERASILLKKIDIGDAGPLHIQDNELVELYKWLEDYHGFAISMKLKPMDSWVNGYMLRVGEIITGRSRIKTMGIND